MRLLYSRLTAWAACAAAVGFLVAASVVVVVAGVDLAVMPALAQEVAEPAGSSLIWEILSTQLPAWAVAAIVIVRQVAELVGKLIPDDATGALGWVRRIAKFFALYVPNRPAR